MASLNMRRGLFFRFVSCLIIVFLVFGDPSFLTLTQSHKAYASQVDPYGFPLISGTPAGETKGVDDYLDLGILDELKKSGFLEKLYGKR